MVLFYVIYGGPGLLILIGCCLVFWLKKTHGFWAYFILGWALQVLLALPAGIWQSISGWPHISVTGTVLWRRFLIPLMGWYFNAGGYSVRYMFGESTPWRNLPYYLLLMALQTSIVASIFAVRYKRKKTFVDWVIICLGILFLINSLVNVTWYWGVG